MTKTAVAATAKVTGTHNNQKVKVTHNNQSLRRRKKRRQQQQQWRLQLRQQSAKS